MLNLAPLAVNALIATREIPHEAIIDGTIYFCPESVIAWGKTRPNLTIGGTHCIEQYKMRFAAEAPGAAQDLKEFGKQFAERKPPKLYYLVKISSKKMGHTWYVKYSDNGRLVPSKWSTGTSDEYAAAAFAIKNREAILSDYYARKAKKPADIYKLFSSYYEKDSELLNADVNRGRKLCDKRRRQCLNGIKKKFIPFLRKNNVRVIEDIDAAMLSRFQDHLLKTMLPKSVNDHVSSVRIMFERMVSTGYVNTNPFAGLPAIKKGKSKKTGCYEIDKVNGAFNQEWKPAQPVGKTSEKAKSKAEANTSAHHILCLLIYATGMRNSEINRLQLSDIVKIGGETFIDIPKSKTPNGERKVPLHPFVHKKLLEYAKGSDVIFPQVGKTFEKRCSEANIVLGERLGHTPESLEADNIRFYSGRHFWKTLMSSENLGENAEKLLMGHKVHGDIANTYNHLDKVGAEKLGKVARDVFAVLDRCLFARASENNQ